MPKWMSAKLMAEGSSEADKSFRYTMSHEYFGSDTVLSTIVQTADSEKPITRVEAILTPTDAGLVSIGSTKASIRQANLEYAIEPDVFFSQQSFAVYQSASKAVGIMGVTAQSPAASTAAAAALAFDPTGTLMRFA